jgi:hypothetical protein
VKVDGHHRSARKEAAEVGEGRLRRVLGKHRHAVIGPQIHGEQPVGDAVERGVDLAPGVGIARVAKRDLIRPLVCEALGKSHVFSLSARTPFPPERDLRV